MEPRALARRALDAQPPVEGLDSIAQADEAATGRISAADPSLYQLQIDSTVINLQTCTDLIVAAYQSLIG